MFVSGSVNLEWIAAGAAGLGVGAHSVADDGSLAVLARDPNAARGYVFNVITSSNSSTDHFSAPVLSHKAAFALDPILRSGCSHNGAWAYALTATDINFLRPEDGAVRRNALQIRHDDLFLDLKVAGNDKRRTAAVLTQDRDGTLYTLTLLEAPDSPAMRHGGSAMHMLWSKTWKEAVQAFSLSANADFAAVAFANGNVVLLDRQRRTVWAFANASELPVSSVTVADTGAVVTVDSRGAVQRHKSNDGSPMWLVNLPIGENPVFGKIPVTMLSIDAWCGTVLCGINQADLFEEIAGHYAYLNGATGEIIWEDQASTGLTGLSIAPAGRYSGISTLNGDVMMMQICGAPMPPAGLRALKTGGISAAERIAQATRAFNGSNFPVAVSLLNAAYEQDPSLNGCGSLYEEATWSLREAVLIETKSISAASLTKVDDALILIPNDERLTIRRNALARLLAEQLGREAGEYLQEGLLEEAIVKLSEALTIDRTQAELRNALRSTSDQLALRLIKDADAAFNEGRFEEAIAMLERVELLRPGEPPILRRLQHARGLQAFAVGMKLYISKRYREAGFWFRKTLSILPDHAEAERYLTFAERYGGPVNAAPSDAEIAESNALAERFGSLD